MANKMLIDAAHPEETRVVVVRGTRLEELDYESSSKRQLRGNIYLAKVTRVEPSLQAAFIDYGGNRHGFLAFSEIHPDYYQIPHDDRVALIAAEAEDERDEDAEPAPRRSSSGGKPRRGENRRRGRRGRSRNGGSDRPPHQNGNGVAAGEAGPGPGEDAEDDYAAAADESYRDGSPSGSLEADGYDTESFDADGLDNDGLDVDGETSALDAEAFEAEAFEADGSPERHEATIAAADETGEADEDDEDMAPEPDVRPLRVSGGAGVAVLSEDAASEEVGEAEPDEDEGAELSAEAEDAPATEIVAASGPDSQIWGEAYASSRAWANDDDGEEDGTDPTLIVAPRELDEDSDEIETLERQVEPETIGGDDGDDEELTRRRRQRLRRYKIQEVIKKRQILLVQVVKEERGNKGAALTTYLSLAGRYSVLMPNTAKGGGISRKITSAGDRKRLKEIADELDVPPGMGLIVRTAGANRTQAEVKRDYEYLLRLWESVRDLTLRSTAPALVYEEGNLIKRSIRDLYNKDIDAIHVQGEAAYRDAREFMRMLMPSNTKHVQLYSDPIPLFHRFQIEQQLDQMFSPVVQLRSGGYVVLNPTEALVAIDVNSGKSTREHSIEDTALQTNLEAAEEIARQLRLRDLAGLIVIDFIDMEDYRNNRAVERRLKECLKNDRARIQVGRISSFGLLEMSRQRLRSSLFEGAMHSCPHCAGVGIVPSVESAVLSCLRALEAEALKGRVSLLKLRTEGQVASYLLNNKRRQLVEIEGRYGITIQVIVDEAVTGHRFEIDRIADAPRPIPIDVERVSVVSGFEAPLREADDTEADEVEADGEPVEADGARAAAGEDEERDDGRKRRRRRRRRGSRREDGETDGIEAREGEPVDDGEITEAADGVAALADTDDAEGDDEDAGAGAEASDEDGDKPRRRRRGRRGGRRHRRDRDETSAEASAEGETDDADAASGEPDLLPSDAPEPGEPVPAIAEASLAADIEMTPRPNGNGAHHETHHEALTGDADEQHQADAAPPAEDAVETAESPSTEPDLEPRRDDATPGLDPAVAAESRQPTRKGWWQRKFF